MIRGFIYSLIALGAGAWLYTLAGDDPGYVLISFGSWSIESTFIALILFLLLLLVLVYGVYKLLGFLNPLGLLRGNSWLGASRRKMQAAAASEEGLRLLLLGHWQDAYKLLVENAGRVENPVFNYLAASLAAWQRGDDASWNYCLEQASRKARKPNPGIKTLKALLEYRSGKIEQSLAILIALDKEVPGSPYVLNLIKSSYLTLQDWEKLEGLMPVLEKHKVVNATELLQLREKIAARRLDQVTQQTGGASALTRQWESLDKKVRQGEEITRIYMGKLMEFSQHEEAVIVATRFLKKYWSDKIVLKAGYIDTDEPGRLLVQLENWLKARPNNCTLMLSLGRVSLRNKLWGKAREYFESSLKFSQSTSLSAEANAELARLMDHMGEHAQSAALYRKAMAQLDHKLPDLPMP
jgi:HemY protein